MSTNRYSANHAATEPTNQELSTLVTLFTKGRYTEATTLAKSMTARFPMHAFSWKMLGGLFQQMGRFSDSLTPFQKAAELLPSDAETHNYLGFSLQNMNRLDEAEASYRQALHINPNYADASYNLGIALKNMGRLREAEASYRLSLQIKPDFSDAHYNLGNILTDMGRLDEAEASYRQALHFNPDYADAHYNLGITLHELGRSDEAEVSYRRVLQIKPGFAEAHNYLGIALMKLGRLEEAEASCRRALQIKPDFVEAHCNLGSIFLDMNRLEESETSYRQALQINPDFTLALNNLAVLLNSQGKSMAALTIIKQSLQIKEAEDAKSIFVTCVKRLRFTHFNGENKQFIVRALTEPWGRPSDLTLLGIELLKLNPDIWKYVVRAANAWPLRLSVQELFGSDGLTTLAGDQLLYALLDSAPICGIEMERFLTLARFTLLEAATAASSNDDTGMALGFYSALARQCFINEYVFSYTDDEFQKASNLRDALVAALQAKTQVPALWTVAVAAYFPLYSLPLAHLLLDSQWPDEVAIILGQQVREPIEELHLQDTIPRITNIEDEVSLMVQNQYEENPYPRWIKLAPTKKAKNIVEYLCQLFPLASFKRLGMSSNIDILIAGCGTGQHSIGTAQQLRGARVLAVDLSMRSLGYAKRKTLELGLTSIEYAQADLLKLGSLGRSFDVIQSSGVLHHLADPWAGWRVLLSLLRPGGFMKLGFYSEVARRNIVKSRTIIAEQGYGATAHEIRQCRQDLMNLEKSTDLGSTLQSPDFFSTSACRDLLFHVQEHRMTLASIGAFLRENNLAFLGFEIEGYTLHAYKLRFPDDRAATNLSQWQIFENENPDTFFGMYQFWVQKTG